MFELHLPHIQLFLMLRPRLHMHGDRRRQSGEDGDTCSPEFISRLTLLRSSRLLTSMRFQSFSDLKGINCALREGKGGELVEEKPGCVMLGGGEMGQICFFF